MIRRSVISIVSLLFLADVAMAQPAPVPECDRPGIQSDIAKWNACADSIIARIEAQEIDLYNKAIAIDPDFASQFAYFHLEFQDCQGDQRCLIHRLSRLMEFEQRVIDEGPGIASRVEKPEACSMSLSKLPEWEPMCSTNIGLRLLREQQLFQREMILRGKRMQAAKVLQRGFELSKRCRANNPVDRACIFGLHTDIAERLRFHSVGYYGEPILDRSTPLRCGLEEYKELLLGCDILWKGGGACQWAADSQTGGGGPLGVVDSLLCFAVAEKLVKQHVTTEMFLMNALSGFFSGMSTEALSREQYLEGAFAFSISAGISAAGHTRCVKHIQSVCRRTEAPAWLNLP